MLAIISGALLALAFPRPGFFPLVWIALVPLVIALRGARARDGFVLGLAAGIVFFGILMFWVTLFGYLPWALLSIAQAVQIAVFGLATVLLRRRRLWALSIPAAWTLLEWLKSLGAFAVPWGGLAYSQADWPSAIQIASLVGPWGVTFLIVAFNVALASYLTVRSKKSGSIFAVTAAICVINAIGGWANTRVADSSTPETRVGIVQGGVELSYADPNLADRVIKVYWPLTESLRGKADLIVWPESALPDDMLNNPALYAEIARLSRSTGAYILAGGYHSEADPNAAAGYREYNGAYLVTPQGELAGKYYKVHLVPFGEFVPARKWLPFIKNYRVQEVDRSPGREFNTVRAGFGSLGTMICFESTFPAIGREFVNHGAGALVIMTNDSWFKQSAAPAQHHQFAVFRAVETRRWVVRAASTGISSVIAPDGRVKSTVGLGKSAVITGKIAMSQARTPFVRLGDWFVCLCAAVVLFAILFGVSTTTGRSR